MGRNSALPPPRSDLAVFAGDCRGVFARHDQYEAQLRHMPVTPNKIFRVRSDEDALRRTSRLHPREARGRVVRIWLTTEVTSQARACANAS